MKRRDERPESGSGLAAAVKLLNRRPQMVERQNAHATIERLEASSPEETKGRLHELRAYQTELEAQNQELERAQAEIEALRARYFDLFDLAPISYFTVSERGLILEANRTSTSLFGAAKEILVRQQFFLLIHKSDRWIYHQRIKQLIDSGQPQSFELRMMANGGGCFQARLEATLARNEVGVQTLRLMVSDITQRKQTETRLQESEERYRTLTAQLDVGVLIQLPSSEIVLSNPKAFELLGLTEQQLIGKTSLHPGWHVVHEDGTPFPGAAHPVPQAIATGQPVHDVIMGVYRPSTKDRIWLLVNAYPQLNSDGSVQQVICTFSDITQRKESEARIEESRARTARLIQAANVGLWDWNLLTNELYFSPEWKQQLGYRDDELTNHFEEWEKRLHRSDHDAVLTAVQEFRDGHRLKLETEFRLRHKDGSYRWILAQGDLTRNAAGEPARMMGSHIDITERKETEAILLSSKKRLKEAQAISQMGNFHWEAETDHLTWSDELFRIFGREPGGFDASIANYLAAIHPDHRDRVRTTLEGALASKGRFDHDYRIVWPDGSVHWVQTRGGVILDEGKNLLGLEGTCQDITRRKEAETAIQQSEERLQYALDATRDGIWDWNIPTGEVYFSPRWARLLGYSPEEVPQRIEFYYAIVHPEEMELIEQVLDDHVAGRSPLKQAEIRLKTKSGEYRWFLDRGKVVTRDQNGSPSRMVGTITDITDRRLAEEEKARLEAQLQQAQKMESIGRLAGGVAHDFNNMLGVILANTELAMSQLNSSEPIEGELAEIQQAALRSADLTRQLLAYARKQTVVPRVLDLNQTVTTQLKLLQRLIGEGIHLNWLPEVELWSVRIDSSQVDQLLANLCINARDAIRDVGMVTIQTSNCVIGTEFCANNIDAVPGEYVRLTVSDTGSGMDKETLAHIFEPFFTTKAVGEGTGLGLATVYGAVKQNQGFITVSSTPNLGTTFAIHLPRHVTKNQHITGNDLDAPKLHGQETVLLVEDEPAILKVTTKLLQAKGYSVLGASSPEEAVRLARMHKGQVHMLLTDVVMPEMNGRDLAKKLTASFANMKCLFMSGYTSDVIAKHGVLEEGVDFIQKPFSVTALVSAVRRVLDSGAS